MTYISNAKFSGFYFLMERNLYTGFRICMTVPLILTTNLFELIFTLSLEVNFNDKSWSQIQRQLVESIFRQVLESIFTTNLAVNFFHKSWSIHLHTLLCHGKRQIDVSQKTHPSSKKNAHLWKSLFHKKFASSVSLFLVLTYYVGNKQCQAQCLSLLVLVFKIWLK